MKMNSIKITATVSICFICLLLWCNPSVANNYKINDWEIFIDSKSEIITVSKGNLGTVLDKIEFQVLHDGELTKLTGLNWEKLNEELIIHSEKPVKTDLKFVFKENGIIVNFLGGDIFIRAISSAPIDRFPARVAEPENMLEIVTPGRSDFTGVTQVEKHYIPNENPHVMYLSLGAIESSNLHALFDKETNTVIKFSSDSQLKRLPEDQTFMEITTPVIKDSYLIELIPDYFTDVLGNPNYIPYDDTYHKVAPTGWNHWLAFFRQVTEDDIVKHANFISENLKQFGMEHCQLDDGYDHVSRRLWVKNWDPVKFPNGPEWLAKYIKSKGLIPGLWTVPYCYSVNDADPEWFLRDDEGNILMDYQGGGELDFTREDVIQEYWIPLWQEFKRQGWEYHKFDIGNTAYMWHTYQHNFSDTTMSAYDASVHTMKIWREIMGPEVWHTNHPDADGGRMGFLDVAGLGRDPGVGWERMNNMLEVISNNTYQNHIIWYSDPDCIVLRGKPTRADYAHREFGKVDYLTFEEAKTCASLLSLSGMQYLSGDDLLNLEEERMTLLKKTIPALPIFPVDLFGRGRDHANYPEIMDLKVNQNARVYDVVAVTNWENTPKTGTISFEKELSLEAGQKYVVFDFWKEELIGEFYNDFQFEIPPHGTRVFFIHKQSDQPLLLGTNRHISGTFGIENVNWEESEKIFSGVSKTVPGVQYSLYFSIPENFKIENIDVNVQDVSQKNQDNGLFEISFTGQEEAVNWLIQLNNIN